ncbi:putative neutral sphingomyelinase [Lepeophtheirus salmonis]|uniref:putative neutral sphingomyelinase n=1 Tax=Lepeophtheirus salmonis TaxID=72036 RepID=UPI001AE28486|nr:putative neutral sphingomyelinase [Lepeophtheirus salmonis]
MADDRFQLLNTDYPQRIPRHKLRHVMCILFLAIILVLFIIGLAVYFGFYFGSHHTIKILSLNVWGLPYKFGSLDKEERILKIAEMLRKDPQFDVVFFQELWMPADHATIELELNGDYCMTSFDSMNNNCMHLTAPFQCSGLAVLSKYPFHEVEFHAYNESGHSSEEFIDGENFVNKGVGRVRLLLPGNTTADFFLTHTIADAPPGKSYTNEDIRLDQVSELVNNGVKQSTADIVILGGDLNASPDSKPYQFIKRCMRSTALDIFKILKALFDPVISTYANPKNTWSVNITDPIMYDHIFYKVNNPDYLAWTNIFSVPIFHFLDDSGKKKSVSDHEGIIATLYYRRK